MILPCFRSCIAKITAFLLGIAILGFHLKEILHNIFTYNVHINSVILACIIIGIFLVYQRIFLYNREYSKLLAYDKLGRDEIDKLKIIKPVYLYISKSNKFITQNKIQSVLASIEKRTDEYNALPKYISGILIFLGLLGTFWGLSHTIGNVAEIIDNLGIEKQDAAASFLQLKRSLKIPLSGMGIAFGCSLFGLSGSLIVGFLAVQMRKVSENFIDSSEEWITKKTISLEAVEQSSGPYHGHVFSMALLEKTIETIYAFQGQLNDLDSNRESLLNMQRDISDKLYKLTEAMAFHQDVVNALSKNQVELQSIAVSISKKMTDNVWYDIANRLSSIETTIQHVIQSTESGRKIIVNALSNDIRMISKTLSSLIRE